MLGKYQKVNLFFLFSTTFQMVEEKAQWFFGGTYGKIFMSLRICEVNGVKVPLFIAKKCNDKYVHVRTTY